MKLFPIDHPRCHPMAPYKLKLQEVPYEEYFHYFWFGSRDGLDAHVGGQRGAFGRFDIF